MPNKLELKTINLDVYESLENFIKADKAIDSRIIKANVSQTQPNSTVEFLRYFIV